MLCRSARLLTYNNNNNNNLLTRTILTLGPSTYLLTYLQNRAAAHNVLATHTPFNLLTYLPTYIHVGAMAAGRQRLALQNRAAARNVPLTVNMWDVFDLLCAFASARMSGE